jgi:sugar O-acyltransferase (sialic acid O-acetyltransferase NeuD family)
MPTLYLCGAGNSEGVRLAQTINQQQSRWRRIAILDDDPAKHGQSILGVEIAGPFAMLEDARADSDEVANMVARTAVKRWAARCKIEEYGLPFTTLINSSVETAGAEFGRDTIVYQNATIGPLVSMDEATVVFMGGVVGHGSKLGRCCVVAPNAVINARVQLGDGVYVGSNATILPEVKVGSWATIGAGTVVTHDVPVGATVMGVPHKIVLTLELKLKMGAFRCLPEELRHELEGRGRQHDLRLSREAGHS